MNEAVIDAIAQAARRARGSLWWVGGPVRDGMLGRPCDDWDLVCLNAKGVAQSTAKTLKAKFIVLDEIHRIYRVVLREHHRPLKTLDFAELQGKTIDEDLSRRDFTINAMARPFPEGAVFDPLHGQRDLRKKVIRMVSEKALKEDPLRLVRAFRFAAQFQFAIEPRTLRAIRKHRLSLSRSAVERIREELLRLWRQPHSSAVVRLMDRTGLLTVIFPEIEACRRTAVRYYGKGGVLKHSLETVENLEWLFEQIGRNGGEWGSRRGKRISTPRPPHFSTLKEYLSVPIGGYPRSAWLKFGAFLHDIGKPATAKMLNGRLRFFEHEHVGASLAMKMAQRLRCSRQEVQVLGLWVRHHMRTGSLAAAPRITDKALSRYFRDLGENGVGMILVSLADHYTYLSRKLWGKGKDPVERISLKLIDLYFRERSKVLPQRLIDGHAIMRSLKLKPGPLIGKILEKIQDAQVEGKVTTKEEALKFAKRFMN